MNLPDENRPGLEDADTLRCVRAHADAVDRALPALSGTDIRQTSTAVVVSTNGGRGRLPFLAAAALLIAGGVAMFALGRGASDTQLEAATSSESLDADQTDVDVEPEREEELAEVEPEGEEDVAEADGGQSEPGGFPDLTPIPVAAADFGAADVRYLPSLESGFVVADGSRVLLSDADLEPETATPVRSQRVTLPATDPADRRGIVLALSTYATEVEADAVIEAEPTLHGVGEPADIGGMSGAWHEEEGFAPYSAGNPMRVISTLRVRLDVNTVLDVAAADVPRTEIEDLVTSLVISEDGSLETPTPPVGFDSAEPISARHVIDHRPASDYLSLGLVGVNGERVSLTISAESGGLSAAGAHFETASGYGWIETGLFGETVVSFVGPEVKLVLVNYDGQLSADELIALGGDIQPVDDETWVEQLAIAPLFDAPVSTVSNED